MSLPWLDSSSLEFPDVRQALVDPSGLLAAGGDLSPERLLAAYRQGIFPWYEEYLDDGTLSPILWWCPQPRCVLYTESLKVSRSLRKSLKNSGFTLSCDQSFSQVIQACAQRKRPISEKNATKKEEGEEQIATWISPVMIEAYVRLHELGHAHSIECWYGNDLVGGLYGVSIGGMFFGESMFSHKRDASKCALIYLNYLLQAQGSEIVDCQIMNPHLESLGAKEIELEHFIHTVGTACKRKRLSFPTKSKTGLELHAELFDA